MMAVTRTLTISVIVTTWILKMLVKKKPANRISMQGRTNVGNMVKRAVGNLMEIIPRMVLACFLMHVSLQV